MDFPIYPLPPVYLDLPFFWTLRLLSFQDFSHPPTILTPLRLLGTVVADFSDLILNNKHFEKSSSK